MSPSVHSPFDEQVQDADLLADERWQLIQRILASEGFQRAGQLRKILVYVSRSAILNPDAVLREYEIACDVLQRRRDFDPANDNIVRAQFTHLRRKLERYFTEEGSNETLCLTIPKGRYIPVFTENVVANKFPVVTEPAPFTSPEPADAASDEETAPTSAPPPVRRRWWIAAALVGASACVLAAALALKGHQVSPAAAVNDTSDNPFVQLLARSDGNVSVVLPDTSQMMIQYITDLDISPADYASSDFPKKQIDTIKDPEVRYVLTQLGMKRNTTVSEAKMGFDFVDAITRAGGHGTVRYARDLHVRDFAEGNNILIGSPRSNPWTGLFNTRPNFRYMRNPTDGKFCFMNIKPLPGEDKIFYINTESKDRVNYVDVAFMQNSLQTGYILLVIGTDVESGEAASKFLLHGRMPPEIRSILARKDIHEFEFFLRGHHIMGESEDALEVISFRPKD